jgi:hypothetical protein
VEASVKVSAEVYYRVKHLAEATDRSIREMADLLLTERIEALDKLGRLADGLGPKLAERLDLTRDDLLGSDATPTVYSCESCGHEVSLDEKPEFCPSCQARLNWAKVTEKKADTEAKGTGMSMGNWAVIALLALSAVRGIPIKV